MTDPDTSPTSSSPTSQPSLPASAAQPAPVSRYGWWPLALAAGVAIGAAAWIWLVQEQVHRLERDIARRVQAVELKEQQREEQLRLTQDLLRDAQAKASVLEAKLAESAGQQAQLKRLYDEMARSRGDMMLIDVETSVNLAAQQLQLGGNVQTALLALQDAEQVLARSNQPAAIGLRRLVARDIEQLKELPVADMASTLARLDAVLAAIDQMPLLADVAPARPQRADQPTPAPEAEVGSLAALSSRLSRTGQQGWEAFLAEVRQLVRVQRIDAPEALLLAPEQRYFVRENLRLMLLNARNHLLARNEPLLGADLGRAIQAIERYFDANHRMVGVAKQNLRQLQQANLAVQPPSLSETLAAVRTARSASEAVRR
jgi:uroporphyrin-III C-methyltransferase